MLMVRENGEVRLCREQASHSIITDVGTFRRKTNCQRKFSTNFAFRVKFVDLQLDGDGSGDGDGAG